MSHGTYVAMQTRSLALGRWYVDLVADKPVREDTDNALPVYQPRHLWFLAPAFVLLCAAFAVPDLSTLRAKRKRNPHVSETRP